MVVIVWELGLQLPVPITIKVVNSNLVHGEMCSIQHYVIKFVGDLTTGLLFSLSTSVFPTNKTDCHNIVESGIKHHQPAKQAMACELCDDLCPCIIVHVQIFHVDENLLKLQIHSSVCAIYAH